jgi:hypothetical protein
MAAKDGPYFVLVALVISLSSPAAAAGTGPIAVHGDSTAIASRIPLIEKFWNLVPQLDGWRWWNILARSYSPARPIFDDGVGGQTITEMRDKMLADHQHRRDLTIIYDFRNPGETPTDYLTALAQAVGTLQTTHFLILPQSEWAGRADLDQPNLREINRRVLARWPANTFSATETVTFRAALAAPSTRVDGFHRNAQGQKIEARFIKAWIDARGW